ncbi:CHAT domain-containing protein [bacterium]|nr:CHAT domain-containing protein [bacterium]
MKRLFSWLVGFSVWALPLWAQPPQQWAERALQHEKAGQLDQAEQAWLQAVAGYQRVRDQVALGRAYFYLGRLCFQTEKPIPARAWLEKAQAAFARSKELKGLALVALQLGLLDKEEKNYPQAEQHLRTALEAAKQSGDEAREYEVLGHLASLFDIAHRWSEAEDAYKRLADYQRLKEHADLAQTLVTLGAVYQVQSEGNKARSAYREAQGLFVKQGKTDDSRQTLSRLARMLLTVGQFEDAEKVYSEILAVDAGNQVARANRAFCLEKMGREPEALQEYESLLAASPKPDTRESLQDQRIRLLYRTGATQPALDLLAQFPDPRKRARLLQDLGETTLAVQTLESLHAQVQDRDESISLANQLGVLHLRLHQHQQAAQVLKESLQRFPVMTPAQRASLLTNLAETHLDRDDYEPAVALLDQAIPLWKEADEPHSLMTALNNLASAHQSQGRWDQALHLLRQAQEVGDAFQKPAAIQGTVANSLGLLYVKSGRYQEGMDYYHKALGLRRNLRDSRGEMITLANMGAAELGQKSSELARQYFSQATELSQKLNDRRMQATLCNNLALAFPDDPASEGWLQRALSLTTAESEPYDRAVALANLANRLASQGKFEAARASADEALALFQRLGSRDDQFLLLDFYLRYNQPLAGQATADTMLNLLEELLRGLPSRLARAFVQEHLEALARVVEWSYRHQQARGLLESEERVRALGVLALTRALPDQAANLSPSLRQRLASLEERLAQALRQTAPANMAELKREYGLICEEVERVNLAAGVVHKARSATVTELQSSLKPNEMLVEFIDLSDNRMAVLVEKDRVQVIEIGTLKSQMRLPRGLSNSDTPRVLETWGQGLWAPWAALVGPHIERLIIIPTGPLYRVPFAAISLDQRPMIERYQVDCSTSATAWLVSRQSPHTGKGTLLAALGGVQLRPDIPALPGTLKELESLQKLWPRAISLSEMAMTRSALQHKSAGCRLLHFATHGLLDPGQPLLGGLATSDGMVTVADIFHWQLDAELAVLSACNTGQFGRGEEYVGLSRAFQCAGARTLLVTLWSISDEATASWMQTLHTQLSHGKSLAQAHQAATLQLRKSQPQPFFWAPFVIWGDGDIRI